LNIVKTCQIVEILFIFGDWELTDKANVNAILMKRHLLGS
jgi:hypothetical protein